MNHKLNEWHFFLDTYVEVADSRCLRNPEPVKANVTNVLIWDIQSANIACSKNRRCVGIEYNPVAKVYPLCLDAIYRRTTLPAAEKLIRVFKTKHGHGKCKN